jgi:GT2 family glycosyltransferase
MGPARLPSSNQEAEKAPRRVLASVVVVPREGFRIAPRTLARLLAVTSAPFDLIYVDCSPRRVASRLKNLVRSHSGGVLLRADRFLRPTTARNLGLARVATPYTVFLDNDVLVTPGWLDALVRCAKETGAAFVSPVICIGDRDPRVVHFAGGENRVELIDGSRRFRESYEHVGSPVSELVSGLGRRPTELAEFHAVLVRTEVLRALGGLDESCPAAFEHNDLCLSISERGGSGWLEPGAVVDYVIDRPAALANAPYHAIRWSRHWLDESLAGFCAKWGLDPADPALAEDLRSLHERRRRPFHPVRGLIDRLARGRGLGAVDRFADAVTDGFARWIDRHPPSVETTTAPGRRTSG